MTAKRYNLLILLCLLTATLVPGGPARGQAPGIEESFDDDHLPGWNLIEGASVEGGSLQIEPGGYASYPAEWRDLTLTLRVMPHGSTSIVIGYRVSGPRAYLLVLQQGNIALQQESDGTVVELANVATSPVAANRWTEIEIELRGTMHRISSAGQEVLAIEVEDPLPPGGVSFEVLGPAAAAFDDVRVETSAVAPSATAELLPVDELTWIRTGGPLGGLGYDVRMHPEDPDIMFVTDSWAGLFKSLDGGRTWFPSSQGITTRTGDSGDAIPTFCLTIDPHNPDIVWAGTQNQRGIFKSTNGGETWTEMDNGVVEEEGISFRGFTVDPRSSDIVYAAAEISGWTWAGRDMMGREFDRTRGVVYKTTDGGRHWRAVWRGDNLARYIWINPDNPEIVYVSTGIFDREAANSDPQARIPGGEGVVKSTDGGQTWQSINDGLDNWYVGSLFMHPENPQILLAGTGNIQYYDDNGIYLTTNGGASWRHVLQRDNITSVEFSVSDPDIAIAASADAIYRSDDAGESWERIVGGAGVGWGPPGVLAGFPIDLQIDPRDPDRIFANNYGGGNFLSTDGGRTWSIASTGYTGAQVRAIAVDPIYPGRVYAAARSGLFVSHDGGDEWIGIAFPPVRVLEWNAVAVDPQDQTNILASNNWQSSIVRSRNGGENWQVMQPQLEHGYGWRAITYAPSDSDIVYAGTSAYVSAGTFDNRMDALGVYKSTDGGGQWTQINSGQSRTANIPQIAVDPRDPRLVYLASSNRGVLKSTDGGGSWTLANQGLPGQPRVLSVAIDPFDSETVFAGVGGAGLYRSRDGGASWRAVPAGLNPEARVSSIVFSPTERGLMLMADRFSGAYLSSNGGDSWTRINQGLTMRTVGALAMTSDGLHVYAATEGGGVFRLDLDGQPPAQVPAQVEQEPTRRPTQATPRAQPTLTQGPEVTEPEATQVEEEAEQEGPLPCPGSTYSMVLLGAAFAGYAWRRGRRGRTDP